MDDIDRRIWSKYVDWREDANTKYLAYVNWCQVNNVEDSRILNFVDYWSQRNAS